MAVLMNLKGTTQNTFTIGKKSSSQDNRIHLNTNNGLANFTDLTGTHQLFGNCDWLAQDTAVKVDTKISPQVIDLTVTNTSLKGYVGGVFTGTHLYLSPYFNGAYHGNVAIINTSTNAVSLIDLSSFDSNLVGFHGAVYTGKYIYFIPYRSSSGIHGNIAKYDIESNTATLLSIPTITGNSNCIGYSGGVFTGRYIYLCPSHNGTDFHGNVVKIDTTNDNMTVIDLTTTNTNLKGYNSGVFTGSHIYMAPYNNGTYHGNVAIIDIATDSVSTIDLQTTDPELKGFSSVIQLNNKLYFVPCRGTGGNFHGKCAVLDIYTNEVTKLDLESAGYVGFRGGCTTGSTIVFSPFQIDSTPSYNPFLVTYDPVSNLINAIDLSQTDTDLRGYWGSVYDGTNVWLVPYHNNSDYNGKIVKIPLGGVITPGTATSPLFNKL